ncbi:MAG: hypothetical protein LC634_00925 [Sphingomonadales bacterium]|nr:hypothetical protein [Sphingomonadales bacterium]
MAPLTPPPVQPQTVAQPAPVAKPAPVPVTTPVTTAQPISPPRIAPVIEEVPELPAVASSEAVEPATRRRSTRTASAADPVAAARPEADVADTAPVANGDAEARASVEAAMPVASAEPLDTGEAAGEASSQPALGEEELALAALAGLLGLGAVGGVMVARRRRKPDADAPAAVIAQAEPIAAEPAEPIVAPAMARTEPERPTRKSIPLGEARVQPAATGSLIDRIDFTRPAGYYESMVDQGPSPINPFLTRRKRIARAKFLDRELERAEERKLAERGGEDFATRLRRPALV